MKQAIIIFFSSILIFSCVTDDYNENVLVNPQIAQLDSDEFDLVGWSEEFLNAPRTINQNRSVTSTNISLIWDYDKIASYPELKTYEFSTGFTAFEIPLHLEDNLFSFVGPETIEKNITDFKLLVIRNDSYQTAEGFLVKLSYAERQNVYDREELTLQNLPDSFNGRITFYNQEGDFLFGDRIENGVYKTSILGEEIVSDHSQSTFRDEIASCVTTYINVYSQTCTEWYVNGSYVDETCEPWRVSGTITSQECTTVESGSGGGSGDAGLGTASDPAIYFPIYIKCSDINFHLTSQGGYSRKQAAIQLHQFVPHACLWGSLGWGVVDLAVSLEIDAPHTMLYNHLETETSQLASDALNEARELYLDWIEGLEDPCDTYAFTHRLKFGTLWTNAIQSRWTDYFEPGSGVTYDLNITNDPSNADVFSWGGYSYSPSVTNCN